MIYRRLGRTGLQVSLLGLGSGGLNPFGQKTGVPEREIHRLVHRALDLGINLIDTAPAYQESESILGRALKQVPRDRYILSTKVALVDPVAPGGLIGPEEIRSSVENSLRRLQVDAIDLLLIGGFVTPELYARITADLLPEIRRLQQEGRFRYLGATEKSSHDGAHGWLSLGLRDDLYDAVMVAYNLINQSAERLVFPLCRQNDAGVINIFTVRAAFSRPARLREVIADLKQRGLLESRALPEDDPLGWLARDDGHSLVSAAYRFAAGNPAVSTVMTGTVDVAHLEENVRLIQRPPLDPATVQRLRNLFGHIAEPVGN